MAEPAEALYELVGALEDAWRRYAAGDERALESNMLRATYDQACEALGTAPHLVRGQVGGIAAKGEQCSPNGPRLLLPDITVERAAEIVRSAFDVSPHPPQRLYVAGGTRAFTRHLTRADVDEALSELLLLALLGLDPDARAKGEQ